MQRSSVSLHRLTPLNYRLARHQTTPPNPLTPQATALSPSSLRTSRHNPSTRNSLRLLQKLKWDLHRWVAQNAKLVAMTKLVLRGVGSTADAYLIPILRQYVDDFLSDFDAHSCKRSQAFTSSTSSSSGSKSTGRGDKREKEGTRKPRVEFMSPDGGLDYGGVVGYVLTCYERNEEEGKKGKRMPVIGNAMCTPQCAYDNSDVDTGSLDVRGTSISYPVTQEDLILAPQQQKQKHDSALEKSLFKRTSTLSPHGRGDPVSHSLMDCLERGLRVQVLVPNWDRGVKYSFRFQF
ncbi:hypothetical protein D9758_017605 [Tetrapyrgos nigripes]|uniref:Uncharacterized protein n=1 Tax=Tetrapyrgos nigripes TaxID=182062 RepID=A0A8H5F1G8_9AGAR|nr:hypothetical protein D9758_017605 [Tetrapyrgos nigripes]